MRDSADLRDALRVSLTVKTSMIGCSFSCFLQQVFWLHRTSTSYFDDAVLLLEVETTLGTPCVNHCHNKATSCSRSLSVPALSAASCVIFVLPSSNLSFSAVK